MLKPGGVFLGMNAACAEADHINASVVLKKDSEGNYYLSFSPEMLNEFEVQWFTEGDDSQGIESKIPIVFIKKQTYERAFKEAGFTNVDIYAPQVPQDLDFSNPEVQ